MNTIKINEMFKSIQGEGRYQGSPALFIRLSGCTRKCKMCDSKYHNKGKIYKFNGIVDELSKLKPGTIIVWTGGEPLLRIKMLNKIMKRVSPYQLEHHLESNGDLIKTEQNLVDLHRFAYVCISPKDLKTVKRLHKLYQKYPSLYTKTINDIKIVTDLDKVGVNMLSYATMVMPLTTYDNDKDQSIRIKVWNHCVNNKKFYSARLHIALWGKKRKI